ncbi:MAG: cytochrome c peroxidase [Bacteroidota bacterium]
MRFSQLRYLWLLLLPFSLWNCDGGPPEIDPRKVPIELDIPDYAPDALIPDDNLITPAKIDLGKKLFFDVNLSLDSTVACGSCHLPEKGFSDPNAFSLGIKDRLSERHAMPLFNLVFSRHFFWDGRAGSLEEQVVDPFINPREMGITVEELERRLKADLEYPSLFFEAFDDSVPSLALVEKAIATFERTLLSFDSKYDQFRATNDSSLFTPSELRGLKLFFDESPFIRHPECFHCHKDPLFDDVSFTFRSNALDETYQDLGRAGITQLPGDIGKFKVPSLRNIEYTAPYMHDGRFATLEEVLDFYASGGEPLSNGNASDKSIINSILITEEGKQDLLAFLKTLSDPSFINNPAHRPE